MKRTLNRYIVESFNRFNNSTVLRFNGFTILFCALIFTSPVRAQSPQTSTVSTRSVSGQFTATGTQQISPLVNSPFIATNTDYLHLDPVFLVISAERIKQSIWRQLDVNPATPWRGQIFLALHPAQSPDENVVVASTMLANHWNYRVELPDILPRTRFTRALTGVILLEFADRNFTGRQAEIPAWLVEGLSQQLLSPGAPDVILSQPNKIVNGLSVNRSLSTESGVDPLAGARDVLKNFPALTFEQLSWPTDAQLDGNDGGAYHASAQLFVDSLLTLKNGAPDLRTMLQSLPQFFNWQTAFQKAFAENFPRPLDVEKWWALQALGFVSRDPGPMWTPATSREKLDEILSVSVEFRSTSNNLPTHAEISLQTVIRNFDSARQVEILQDKLRDLGLAQLRMPRQLAILTDGYRRAIADYLGQDESAPASPLERHLRITSKKTDADEMVKKLDALDAQRRTIEETIKPDIFTPRDLNPLPP